MKKLKFVLTIITVLTFLLALSSCEKPDNRTVAEKIDDAMNQLESYTVSGTIDMTVYVQKQKISASGKSKDILSNLSSDDCYVYSKTNLTYVISEKTATFYDELKAYHNGNAFLYTEEDGKGHGVYSPLSREDFLKYYQGEFTAAEDIDIFNCSHQTYTENENGSTYILLSGYSDEFIDDYLGKMGIVDGMIDDKIADIEITIKVNSKFCVTQMSMHFVFEDDEDAATAPAIDVKMFFSDYNCAAIETDELNVENYNEILDIRLVDEFDDMISDLEESENNSFTLTTSQKVRGQTSSEKDEISYGIEDGKYFYNARAELTKYTCDIAYRDGQQTTTITIYSNSGVLDTDTNTVEQSELEAKAFINQFINSTGYDARYVEGIEKTDDGRYKVSLLPVDESSYRALAQSLRGSYQSSTHAIYFTVEDGKILKMDGEIVIYYSYWNGFDSIDDTIVITAIVDFT